MNKRLLKRIIDVAVSSLAIFALTPLLLCIALIIFSKLGRPILFYQTRIGANGKPFKIVKFRSMVDKYDTSGKLLPDSHRCHPIGEFLRQTSLDELPQLFNVFAGQMSLVGPRPQIPEKFIGMNPKYQRRHCVRPGLTGWAQINGRNSIEWDTKFELDLWYVDNWSIRLDLKILLCTCPVVLMTERDFRPNEFVERDHAIGSKKFSNR
jgi:sugar transferase EpsL